MGLADNARQRIREQMRAKNITQTDLAAWLKTSQSAIGKVLTGRTNFDLDVFEKVCIAVGLSPVEAIRDRGLQFCAEMTPLSFRVHERFLELAPDEQTAIITIMDVKRAAKPERRYAKPIKSSFPTRKSG